MVDVDPAPKRRSRRTSDEVRGLLITAARELFSEKGYADTTTRDVIKRAGVSDQSLFSQFESKQGLFQAAMLEPLGEFIREYVADGSRSPLADVGPENMLHRYVEGLYDLVAANRQVFLAISPEHIEAGPGLEIVLEIERFAERFARAQGLAFDHVFGSRAVLALVVSMALFHENLLPGYDRSRMIRRLTSVLLSGVLSTPAD